MKGAIMAKALTKNVKKAIIEAIPQIINIYFTECAEELRCNAFEALHRKYPCLATTVVAHIHQLFKHKIVKINVPKELVDNIGINFYPFVSSEMKKYMNKHEITISFNEIGTDKTLNKIVKKDTYKQYEQKQIMYTISNDIGVTTNSIYYDIHKAKEDLAIVHKKGLTNFYIVQHSKERYHDN
jgi:uncharacterized protein with ATP-grasp and redox domains